MHYTLELHFALKSFLHLGAIRSAKIATQRIQFEKDTKEL